MAAKCILQKYNLVFFGALNYEIYLYIILKWKPTVKNIVNIVKNECVNPNYILSWLYTL